MEGRDEKVQEKKEDNKDKEEDKDNKDIQGMLVWVRPNMLNINFEVLLVVVYLQWCCQSACCSVGLSYKENVAAAVDRWQVATKELLSEPREEVVDETWKGAAKTWAPTVAGDQLNTVAGGQ